VVTSADEPPPPEAIELVIAEAEAGERLDRVLAKRLPQHSRSTVQRWIAEGRVEVDDRTADRRVRLRAGARVVARPAPPPPSGAEAQDIPLRVLHEDDALLVIDKPAGLVVHPAPGHRDGTLVNAVLHRLGEIEAGDAVRPGIVHRLDKDTSGVMVVAKTAQAHAALVEQFQAHDIEREYLAIAVGAPPERATYETWYGRHPVHRKRFTSRVSRGKRAVTHLFVRERLHGSALLACRLDTGRTHQIRVHLAEHGTPLLGDPLYGKAPRDPLLREVSDALGRQALHAAVLGFRHPRTGEALRFEAPPPADIERALSRLRAGPGAP
jgi:23S rRNA pseudouridine1911/1915/1917 synthase